MLAKIPVASPRSTPGKQSVNLRRAMAVQIIEENPLDAGQIEMFEMFEREQWSHEQRRAYLADRARR